MAEYRVTLADDEAFYMSGHFDDAGVPISACFHDPSQEGDWQLTPFQTADARHSPFRAATLVARHFARHDDDCTEVESVEPVESAGCRD